MTMEITATKMVNTVKKGMVKRHMVKRATVKRHQKSLLNLKKPHGMLLMRMRWKPSRIRLRLSTWMILQVKMLQKRKYLLQLRLQSRKKTFNLFLKIRTKYSIMKSKRIR